MEIRKLRARKPINYYEPEEPPHDAYEYCEQCKDFIHVFCSLHGGLLVIPDDTVSSSQVRPEVPRAMLTTPTAFLYIDTSSIPGAGLGVFAKETLPCGVRFGPYLGRRLSVSSESGYSWEVSDRPRRRTHVLDAGDASRSNWMRYVNCARRSTEQNLIAYQYYGEIYYRTSRVIGAGRELLVYYGSGYAAKLNIDVKMYNKSPAQHIRLKISRRNRSPDKQDAVTTSTGLQKVNARVLEMINFNRYFNNALGDRTEMDHLSMMKSIEVFEKMCKKQSNAVYTVSDEPKVTSTTNDNILDIKDGDENDDSRTEKEQLEFSEDANPKTAKGNWKCKVCNQSLPSREQLRTHIRIHRGAYKFNCEFCDYKTDARHYYRRHELVHKPKETTQSNEDQSHVKPHPGKTWQCGECQQIFETRYKLRHHTRVHGGKYKFKCEICDYKTDEPHFFERHKRAKHKDRDTLICGRCNYRCRNTKALAVHCGLHTNAVAVRCPLCPHLGARPKDVREHARRVHKHLTNLTFSTRRFM